MGRKAIVAAVLLLVGGTPAGAEDLRELCTSRPGLGDPPCTVDPGRLVVELGLIDWTLDRQPDERTDTIRDGDLLLRYGIGPTTELQLGLQTYGHVRTRDRATGTVDRASGVGDATIGLRQNLSHPDGKGFSIALQPFATIPIGHHPVSAGDWGAGLVVPVSYALSDTLSLQASPEIDAAVDEDGDGRHLAYGSVVGLGIKLGEAVDAALEFAANRDRDPEDHVTEALAAASLAWQTDDDTQLDVGSAVGLNHDTPDVRLYAGVSRRF